MNGRISPNGAHGLQSVRARQGLKPVAFGYSERLRWVGHWTRRGGMRGVPPDDRRRART